MPATHDAPAVTPKSDPAEALSRVQRSDAILRSLAFVVAAVLVGVGIFGLGASVSAERAAQTSARDILSCVTPKGSCSVRNRAAAKGYLDYLVRTLKADSADHAADTDARLGAINARLDTIDHALGIPVTPRGANGLPETTTPSTTTTTTALSAPPMAKAPTAPAQSASRAARAPLSAPLPLSGASGAITGVLAAIRTCESGGDYTALNAASGASGAYQVLSSTWAGYGGYASAGGAPAAVQDRFAANLLATQGTAPWASSVGCWGR